MSRGHTLGVVLAVALGMAHGFALVGRDFVRKLLDLE